MTPPPDPTPNPTPANISNGSLLGTQSFQRAVDEFKATITALQSQLSRTHQAAMTSGSSGAPTVGNGGTGAGGAPATFGSSASASSQLTAWQRLRAQTQQGSTLRQVASQAGSGFSSTLFGRAPLGGGTGMRAAHAGGQLARAGASALGSVASTWAGGQDSYSKQLDQYSRQMMLSNPTGGITGGALAKSYGSQLQQYGSQFWAGSASDMFSAGLTINQQAYQQNQPQLLQSASTMAMLNPGMSMQSIAAMQGKFGTMNAYYTSQMMGLTTPRSAGGGQTSGVATINSLANRVNANIGGFQNLSQASFKAEIAQGGSLSSSIAAYGQRIGLSGQDQQALVNQLSAENKLMSPTAKGLKGLSADQAQQTLDAFAKDPTSKAGQAAYQTMQKYQLPIGSTLSEAQNVLQGKQANGYLANSATYLDAAKSAANTLTDINNLLQKVLGPAAGVTGAYKTGGIPGVVAYGFSTKAGDGSTATSSAAAKQQTNTAKSAQQSASQQQTVASQYKAKAAQWPNLPTRGGGASTPGGGSQNSTASGAGSGSSPSGNYSAALAFAQQQLGDPYVYGANGPNAWDCSSLVQAAWKAGGVSLPRTSQEQSGTGTPGVVLPLSQAAPGDLIFYGSPGTASHVGLVTGQDTVLEAPHTGDVVKYEKISQDAGWKFAKRVAGGVGSVTSNLGGGTPGSASTSQAGIGSSGTSAYAALGASEVQALASVLSGGGSVGSSSTSWTGSGADTASTQGTNAGTSSTATATGGAALPSGIDTSGYTAAEKAAVALGQQMAAAQGWTGTQFVDLFHLWNQESTWNANATNPSSGAYGIPQALGHGHPYSLGDAKAQIAWGISYIKGRYKDPATAWAHEQANNWYSSGISEITNDKTAKLHSGEMVLNANQARAVRQAAAASVGGGAAGAGGTVQVNFAAGAVVVQMPQATSDGAKSAANSFVTFVAADPRIKSLMGGQ